ncbi:fibronectin type III domain-containing protein [Halolamina rubra]|uniref:fibronectin type III domain-containing protein n=1 Tax=Halolamina rubra TaxID=1380430 RepID=UPI00067992A0|nr:fibronectin type III domain-containing protein [Halolamina rubra]
MTYLVESFEDQDLSAYSGDTGAGSIVQGGVDGSYCLSLTDDTTGTVEVIADPSQFASAPTRGDDFDVFVGNTGHDIRVTFFREDANNFFEVAWNETWGRYELDVVDGGSRTNRVDEIGSSTGPGSFSRWAITSSSSSVSIEIFDDTGTSLGTLSTSNYSITGAGWSFITSGDSGSGFLNGGEFDYLHHSDAPAVPDTPTVTSHTDTSVTIDWPSVKTADSYNVERSESASGPWSVVGQPTGSGYQDTGLENGEGYHYRVTAENPNGSSSASGSVSQTTDLPAATVDSVSRTASNELTVQWSRNDDNAEGEWEIYRSTASGQLGTLVADGLALSSREYTAAGPDDGERYYLTVRRVTPDATADAQGSAVTELPAPTGVTVDGVTGDQISLSWTDNANNGDYRVLVSRDGGSTWTTDGDNLGTNATSYTTTNLLDGEQYTLAVEVTTEHTDSRSGTVDATTELPDEDQPVLGNGVEDEVAVDRETAVSDYGDVRLQIRETGTSSWDSTATGFAEHLLDHATLSDQFASREDGEEYEVRCRTETEHVTGSWTDPVAIVTKFPGADNLRVDTAAETSVAFLWDDNADNEDGFRIQRRELFRDGPGRWQELADLAPNTTSYTDDAALPNTSYEYRVEAYTDDTQALSPTLEVTTADDGVPTDGIPAEGWHVVVETAAGAQVAPTIVGEPVHRPRLNDLPTVEIPVPDAARWGDSAEWERQPMRVYYDGERLPIEQVQRVRQEPGQAMLVGVGGVALRERVAVDVIEQDAHLTAEGLIQDTPYAAHVDDPAATTTADLLQQSADSESEWDDRLATAVTADGLYETTSTGQLQTRQTAYLGEAEDGSYQNGDRVIDQNSDKWSANEIIAFDGAGAATYHQTDVTTDHDIPADQVGIAVRSQVPNDGHPGFTLTIDGVLVENVSADAFTGSETEPDWFDASVTGDLSGPLSAGSHTIEVDFDDPSDASNPSFYLDCVLLYDVRADPGLGNSVIDGVLQNVHEYPSAVPIQTADAQSVRQVVGGRLEADINDTSGAQAVAISNDSGATWIEAANSSTVEGAFADGSTSIRARFTLGGYDADPSTSPAGRTAPQAVDLYSLYADLEDTPLLANRSWDQTLLTVLQDIASYGNFIFEVVWDESAGSIAVEWTQAGQRTATVDPSLVDYQVETDYSRIHRRAVIYGTGVPEASTITAQHDTWVGLEHDWLHETGEVVESVADGTTYERSVDYELRPNEGELKALSTGNIADGAELRVSYDKRIRGTFESGDYVGEYETFVDDVPAITTTRNADAAALAIVQEASDPLVTASVTIDREPGVSLVEAIDLEQLPVDEPLEVWSVDNQPGRVTMQLGSREEVSETVSRIQERLGATSRKV